MFSVWRFLFHVRYQKWCSVLATGFRARQISNAGHTLSKAEAIYVQTPAQGVGLNQHHSLAIDSGQTPLAAEDSGGKEYEVLFPGSNPG